jgi:nitrate/nitrite transporter NarK
MEPPRDTAPSVGVLRHWLILFSLVLSGACIYNLSYLRQSFESTMLEMFRLSDAQLGNVSALLGAVSLACYLPGGWVADRFSSRKLITFSLIATAGGGFFMCLLPTYPQLMALHAFWGVVTILTYWAALIKATYAWNPQREGLAFGLLDSGRGIFQALLVTLSISVFSRMGAGVNGFKAALAIHASACVLVAILCWASLPDDGSPRPAVPTPEHRPKLQLAELAGLVRMPSVWSVGLIIFCAYFGLWATYNFARFAEQGFGLDRVQAAYLSTVTMWVRGVMPFVGGLLADRWSKGRVALLSFAMIFLGLCYFALFTPAADLIWTLWFASTLISVGVYAVRGVYFPMLGQINIPPRIMGAAVGLVSVLGYTPDIFAPKLRAALASWATDPIVGHQHYFAIIGVLSVVGALAACRLESVRDSGSVAGTPARNV